jgi:gas vesicle protein
MKGMKLYLCKFLFQKKPVLTLFLYIVQVLKTLIVNLFPPNTLARLLKSFIVLITFKTITMNDQKILIGTISGILAGVAIGMLVAPVSGSEARQKIADSAGDLKNKIADQAGELKSKVRNLTRKANVKLDDLRSAFENEIEGLGDDVRQKILKLMDTGNTSAGATGGSQKREGAHSGAQSATPGQ